MSKVVLVTGASSGIGEATVKLFASRGFDVVIHYHKGKDRASVIANEILSNYPVKVLCIEADISNESDVENMINKIIKEFGHLDVLVNNAGIAIDNDFSLKNATEFRKILDINLIGPFIVSKYASKFMKQNKNSAIVNVGSTNGINSYYPYSMDYDASKAGLHILTKDLAIELAPNIRVNAIAPGWVKTPMNKELEIDFIEKETEKITLKRFAEVTEIAKIIYFLSSEESSYINGAIIIADGGRI